MLILKSSEWLRASRELFPQEGGPSYNAQLAGCDVWVGAVRLVPGEGLEMEHVPEKVMPVMRCCLGVHLHACGVPDEEMGAHGEPSEWANENKELAREAMQRGYGWLLEEQNDEYMEDEDDEDEVTVFCHRYGPDPLQPGLEWPRDLAALAMGINDDFTTTDEQKVEALRKLFAKVGWEIDWRPNE